MFNLLAKLIFPIAASTIGILGLVLDLDVLGLVTFLVLVTASMNVFGSLLSLDYSGTIVIQSVEDDKTLFSLELDESIDDLEKRESILFKVDNRNVSQKIHPL